MNDQTQIRLSELAKLRLPSTGRFVAILLSIAVVGGIAAWLNSQFVEHPARRLMQAYLVAFAFVLSVSLGALFFVLVQHLMRAGWSVVVRRIAEVFCLNILVVAVLFLPIGWSVWQGDGLIYAWSVTDSIDSDLVEVDTPHIQTQFVSHSQEFTGQNGRTGDSSALVLKGSADDRLAAQHDHHDAGHDPGKPWLDNTRFLVTWGILFAIWVSLGVFYYRCSVRQDQSADVELTRKMEWCSGIATILFGFSLTFGAFDLLMTLDPMWYSTIFGVYYFSGCAVAGMATLLLVVLVLSRTNSIPKVFSDEVQRDLGRLLFAFVFFWAYIGFSQYMLLWYANMPETTGWMVQRGMSTATGYTNSWGWLAIGLLFAHFLIPFCGFMSRHVKSNSNWMIFWCVWMLAIHYMDLYWIVIPENNSGLTVSLIEIGIACAVIALYLIAAIWIASRTSLFAVGDPRMNESLTRHAMY